MNQRSKAPKVPINEKGWEDGWNEALTTCIAMCDKLIEDCSKRLRGEIPTVVDCERLEACVADVGELADRMEMLRRDQASHE